MTRRRFAIALFLCLTAALSSVWWIVILRAGGLGGGSAGWVFALMWSPGIAALLTQLVVERSLRGLGWRWPGWRALVLAWTAPLFYALPVYLLVWMAGAVGVGLGGFDAERWQGAASSLPLLLLLGTLQSTFSGLGEEIGWRGFLFPRLDPERGFLRASTITGAVWAVWHYPLILGGVYKGETPIWYSLACFTLMVLGISVLFSWLTLRTGSVWPAALLHASHNLLIQGLFDPLTLDRGPTEYLVGEFGAGLALSGLLLLAVAARLEPRAEAVG